MVSFCLFYYFFKVTFYTWNLKIGNQSECIIFSLYFVVKVVLPACGNEYGSRVSVCQRALISTVWKSTPEMRCIHEISGLKIKARIINQYWMLWIYSSIGCFSIKTDTQILHKHSSHKFIQLWEKSRLKDNCWNNWNDWLVVNMLTHVKVKC